MAALVVHHRRPSLTTRVPTATPQVRTTRWSNFHDIRAARVHGIIDALDRAHVTRWAGKGYRGAGSTVRISYWGRWKRLSPGQQAVNGSYAKIRPLVEQAMATLKSWRLLRKIRCSTTWITALVQAALALHLASSDR
jgi:hypothetical protein